MNGYSGTVKIITKEERINEIPNHNEPGGRKCVLTRKKFVKGRGPFGTYYHNNKPNENTHGLAEKHFIVNTKKEKDNKDAALKLSNDQLFKEVQATGPPVAPPAKLLEQNTVFAVEKTFTNENTYTGKPCEDYGCLLDYDKFNVNTGFELPGF